MPEFHGMDQGLVNQIARLSDEQRDAVREWQKTDRFYEQVQALRRGVLDTHSLSSADLDDLVRMVGLLDSAIGLGRLEERRTVYRGVRSLLRTFGAPRADGLVGLSRSLDGYTATSIHRSVAVAGFVGTATGALLELDVPAGTPALWVAGAGMSGLRWQGEVLLPADLGIRVTGARHDGANVVLSVEVVNS